MIVCSACEGKKFVVPEEDRCEGCNGEKVVKDSKILTVEIEPGMQWGQQLSFYGESDQFPDTVTGKKNQRFYSFFHSFSYLNLFCEFHFFPFFLVSY